MATEIVGGVEYRQLDGFAKYRFGSDGSVWSKTHLTGDKWKRRKIVLSGHRPMLNISRDDRKVVTIAVARIILELFVGPCPEGMEACHYPDPSVFNNALVNLRWDTVLGNANDRRLHGTIPNGESHFSSKLTLEAARDIQRQTNVDSRGRLPRGVTKSLCNKYGISPSQFYRVRSRQFWKSA